MACRGEAMTMRYTRRHEVSAYEGGRTPHIAAHVRGPLTARFLDEDESTYLVGEPHGERTARVPKRRAPAERFGPGSGNRVAGTGLLRCSGYAIVGGVLGGVVGIVLGSLVVLVALVRLGRFSRRVRRWRRAHRDPDGTPPLPATATAERQRLLAALGQGLLAVILGCLVYFVLAGLL